MEKDKLIRFALIIFLITGLVFMYTGYSDFFGSVKKATNYETTDGFLYKAEPTNGGYSLSYSYETNEISDDNKPIKITHQLNNYKTVTKMPTIGTKVKIKYDKKNHDKAILVDLSYGIKRVIFGLVLIIISIIGIVIRLLNKYQETDDRFYKKTGIITGIATIVIGILIYNLYGYAAGSSSLTDIWSIITYMTLVPFILFIIGGFVIISSVFLDKED